MKVAVTGGTGFIGRHFAEGLIVDGHQVVLLARGKNHPAQARKVEILLAALVKGRLTRQTVAVTGAEELYLSEAVRRVARVTGKNIRLVRAPIWSHYLMARVWEWTMKVPLVARAQVRILAEGVVEPALPCDRLPQDLMPTRRFTGEQIRKGLPEPRSFGLRDLRCCA